MPKFHFRPIILDPVTPENLLHAGLDGIRRLQGRETSLLEPARLMPWFLTTARNSSETPDEYDFVVASENALRNGLESGRASLHPEIVQGLASMAMRDAALWPDGELAVHEASRSLRNFSLMGIADPFIRAFAMSQLGPIAGPAALTLFDKAKDDVQKKVQTARVKRLQLMVPTAKGDKWRRKRNERKR